jgi:hypothetical protein
VGFPWRQPVPNSLSVPCFAVFFLEKAPRSDGSWFLAASFQILASGLLELLRVS